MKTNHSSHKLSDEELVEQIVKTKSTILFEILYDRFSNLVYNKCLSFSNTNEEAQDLTQEVFIKLYIKLSSYQRKSKFSTWLYAFTYNLCVNYINRDKAKKIEKKAIPIEEFHDLQIETNDHSLFQLKVDKLKKAMEMINPEDKMILLLKYQDDLSIADLSNVLHIGESAVKMRLKRAKAKVIEMCTNKL